MRASAPEVTNSARQATSLVNQYGWFPRQWQYHCEGQPILESGVIERQDRDHYIYRAGRAHPIKPQAVAETTERVFSSAKDVARHYLTWDLRLPGDLDGWKVIE